MTLPPALRDTLVSAASALAEARDPWWIVSGAAAALYGAHPIIVADVDVILSVEDATRLFPRIGVEQAARPDHPRFRSAMFGRWGGCPLIVEFMADFTLRDLDGVWRPIKPATRRARSIGGTTVFVPELRELRDMFEKFGREKDRARIALLDRLA